MQSLSLSVTVQPLVPPNMEPNPLEYQSSFSSSDSHVSMVS